MSQNWYYEQGSVQKGPVPFEELQRMAARGELRAENLVWCEGMAAWEEAGRVPNLSVSPSRAPDWQGHANQGYMPPQPGVPGAPVQLGYYAPLSAMRPNYAGFWWRVLALILDSVLLAIVVLPVNIAADFAFGLGQYGSRATASPQTVVFVSLGVSLIQMVCYLLYYGLMESSKHQATLGKMACGLYVTDAANDRISVGRAMCRYLASILSGLLLSIGYIMGAFTEKKQCLHDIMCGTFVIKR